MSNLSKKQKRMLLRIIISAVIWAAGLVISAIFPADGRFSVRGMIQLVVFTAAYLTIGWDIIWKAVRNIAHGQVFDENFLMAIASIGAMVIGEYSEGAAVMIFYQVGELFQSVAVGKSRRSIAEMVDINPEYANVERGGEVCEVSPEEVAKGEIIVIRPGERIPLDGRIISGSSELNTAALTGESALRSVAEGDEIISGCINTSGLLRAEVSRPYSDSTVARILELVENSSENKAKTENFITKFARIYTPIVVFSAIALAIIPGAVMAGLSGWTDFSGWSEWVYRALTFLVVSCPCALVISVPLSYFGGIGGASRHGIMIKGANYLEQLARARTFVFDKTGTLTKGSFSVTEIVPSGMTEDRLLEICAAAESFSTHPIAQSILAEAEKRSLSVAAEDAQEIAGFGVKAVIDGETALVGNYRLMERENILADAAGVVEAPGTVIYCALSGKFAGYLVICDEIKPGTPKAIAALKSLCGAETVMLTGDRKSAAGAVAEAAGIDRVHAELLPDGKVAQVEALCREKPSNTALAFVGDGMNDAPALARADVGIAMGAMGSDAAIEAADIVLMNDNIESLPLAVRIARKTHRIVMQNIILAIGVKVLIMILTAFGIANMWLAVFGDVGVAVIAILNAMRAMRIKK